MNDWLDRLFNQPIRDNPWSLGLLIVLVLAYVGPVLVMMGRDMWRRKKETSNVNEQPATHGGTDASNPSTTTAPAFVPDEQERAWAEEGIPAVDTVVQQVPPLARGSAPVPAPVISQARVKCEHCYGRGYVPGLNDFLQESIALLGDSGDDVIRTFYSRLFVTAPELAALFPGNPTEGDLGTDHKGAKQREKLLNAIAALANLYDPSDGDKMDHLDQALKQFGRSHAAFVRRDGTIKGATWEEYAAVKDALFTTIITAAGEHWRAEYSEAWSQAYDYAAAVMLAEQYRSGFSAPRFPRA